MSLIPSDIMNLKTAKGLALQDVLTEVHLYVHRSKSFNICVQNNLWWGHIYNKTYELGTYCDGCHMWGRKCSLFLEHTISLSLESSGFHQFVIYTLQNFFSLRTILRINDWLSVCLYYWSDCFVSGMSISVTEVVKHQPTNQCCWSVIGMQPVDLICLG